MTLEEWMARWGISEAAMMELRQTLMHEAHWGAVNIGTSEAAVQQSVRVEAAEKGMILWRNNVGASKDEAGNYFRFGLANDSAQMSKRIKSSDLVGIRPVTITGQMEGTTIGQFVAREVKRRDWKYSGTDREKAQAKYLELVLALGGDAAFCNGPGSL